MSRSHTSNALNASAKANLEGLEARRKEDGQATKQFFQLVSTFQNNSFDDLVLEFSSSK